MDRLKAHRDDSLDTTALPDHFVGSDGRRTSIAWKQRRSIDGYSVTAEGGVLRIEFRTAVDAWAAVGSTTPAFAAGYQSQILGPRSPRFSQRWLWLGGQRLVKVGGDLRIAVPSGVPVEELSEPGAVVERLSNRVLRLGYHGIILGTRSDTPVEGIIDSVDSLAQLITAFHRYGLAVAVRPSLVHTGQSSLAPVDRTYREWVEQVVGQWLDTDSDGSPDCVLWESRCGDHRYRAGPEAEGCLLSDLVSAEQQLAAQAVGDRCATIFLAPKSVGRRAMMQLADGAPVDSSVAFYASDGTECHPIRGWIREEVAASDVPLLPIVNGGGIGLGEGLWPAVYHDELLEPLAAMGGACLDGAIVLANAVPSEQSLLACSLWSCGQTLWDGRAPGYHADTWLRAYRPDWSGDERAVMREVARLGRDVVRLKYESDGDLFRVRIDAILAAIRQVRAEAVTCNPDFRELLAAACRDMRRVVLAAAHLRTHPMGNVATVDDSGPGFWTAVRQGGDGGGVTGANIDLLSSPNLDQDAEPLSLAASAYRF